jgi:hypothetical protein
VFKEIKIIFTRYDFDLLFPVGESWIICFQLTLRPCFSTCQTGPMLLNIVTLHMVTFSGRVFLADPKLKIIAREKDTRFGWKLEDSNTLTPLAT